MSLVRMVSLFEANFPLPVLKGFCIELGYLYVICRHIERCRRECAWNLPHLGQDMMILCQECYEHLFTVVISFAYIAYGVHCPVVH